MTPVLDGFLQNAYLKLWPFGLDVLFVMLTISKPQTAKTSSIKAVQRFAKGLEEDYDAVKAGMTLAVSNGPVEGQNNRLKMLKRQMFGRANLELLEKRFILTS